MKFAFSTLGCPDWDWGEVVASAKDLGYDGIEIRGIGQELYAPKSPYFSPAQLENTKARLKGLGLSIPCLSTACYLNEKENIEAHLAAGREYIDLAASLDTPYIRVMGDPNPQPDLDIDIAFVADNLRKLADYAQGKNVTVLLESNGVFADSNLLKEVLDVLNRPELGALWDVHHPYRFCLEPVEESYANLKPHLRHLHMKDSLMSPEGMPEYKMMGKGDIPNAQVLELLQKDNFQGFVSLEWTKRWNKGLKEPGIVFPHFIDYVRKIVKN